MEKEFLKEQQYLNAKKRVKEIKGFYSHKAQPPLSARKHLRTPVCQSLRAKLMKKQRHKLIIRL